MALHCPFCHKPEQDRILAETADGKEITLLMFDCPFFLKIDTKKLSSEKAAQKFLNFWRVEHGEEWLESIGPLLRKRELRNIQLYESKARKKGIMTN